tara:strand:- start:978 stop:1169 length:192 start_codon:yes stop_codon:yes gene_type:complete
LKKELEAIRAAGKGLVTASKKTSVLKRGIFSRQKEKHVELVTPDVSDDEVDIVDDDDAGLGVV